MTAPNSAERVPIETLLQHREWVRALARSLYFDRNRADDVEQETWRIALERPPCHAASLRAWFATAVRSAAGSAGRKERTRSARESAVVPRAHSPSPEDSVAAAELQTKLARAVLDLDEPYRTAVVLRYFDGLEATEIAARLSVPVETVRTRLKRAIELLRKRMEVEIGGDRDAWCLLLVGVRVGRGKPIARVAAGTSGAAAALGGGAVMAAGTKALAVAVVLATGVVWWLASDHGRPRPVDRSSGVQSTPVTVDRGTRVAPRAHPDEVSATPPAAPTAPRLQGHVVDAEGKPAAGVRVTLIPEQLPGGRPVDLAGGATATSAASRDVRTDANGAFSAEPLPAPGVASALALRDDGAMGIVPAIRPGEDVVVTLFAPASLFGRVTDSAGAVVDQVNVRVGCLVDTASFVRETQTAADGTYRVTGIPLAVGDAFSAAQVVFSADGFAPTLVPVTSPETRFAPGAERRLDARLVRGASLTGVVADAETGSPVGGASVVLVSEEGRMGFRLSRGRSIENPFAPRTLSTLQSAADGTFRVEHLPVADIHSSGSRLGFVRVMKEGYAASESDVRAASDGATIDVRITLRHTATISGRVVDKSGKPVAALSVWAQIGDERDDAKATTDAAGH